MKRAGLIIALSLAVLSSSVWAEDSLEKTLAKANSASPKECAKVCFEAAHKLIEESNRQYTLGNDKEGLRVMNEATAFAKKGVEAAIQTRKNLKGGEISIRKMTRRMHDVGESLSLDDRPPVFEDEKVLQKLGDDMLTAMFGTPKKTLEEKQ